MRVARITQTVIAARLPPSGWRPQASRFLPRREPNSAVRKCGQPRAWPVSTSTSTLIPARSGGKFLSLVSTRTRIGMRWTTLTQLPLVFCAGKSENSCAAAGLMLSTVPRHFVSGYVSTVTVTG